MTRNIAANRFGFLETFSKHLLFLLVAACIAVAQYRPQQSYPPAYPAQAVSYGNSYQPFMTRDLLQSDVKNCTDLSCGMEQCCIETPRAAICVDLTITNYTRNERMCVRPKLCTTDLNCFSDLACCVQSPLVTSDTTCGEYPDYYKYPPHSTPGQVVKPTNGICQLKPNAVNATCFISITNNVMCPCGVATDLTLICVPLFAGAIVGTCQYMP